MSKSLEQVLITKARLNRLETVSNTHCNKCEKILQMGQNVMKKKVRSGNHKYFHMKCYERMFY